MKSTPLTISQHCLDDIAKAARQDFAPELTSIDIQQFVKTDDGYEAVMKMNHQYGTVYQPLLISSTSAEACRDAFEVIRLINRHVTDGIYQMRQLVRR